ncbi:MAG: hypothetical protein JWO78_1334 [Micavibrio sp.]|nr:hypothetical protein [Micavibrio sp.]
MDVGKKQIKNIAIFCGSRFGATPEYKQQAEEVCSLLAADNRNLVYGGGHSGLMGVAFDAFRDAGRGVTAVITHIFRNVSGTVEHDKYTEKVVRSLSSRKQKMIDAADAFVVLPGGFGTMDELFTALAIIDMQMAGRSKEFVKPVIVLNTNGIYDHLGELIKAQIRADFVHDGRQRLIRFCSTPQEVVSKIRAWNHEGIKTAAQLVDEIQIAKAANGNNQAQTLKDMTGPTPPAP